MEYEVKKGDGWYKIAKNLGVNVNDLLQANNAKLDTMLQPGQKLKTSKVSEQPAITNQWQIVSGQNDAVANWAKQRVDTTMNSINQALAEQEANENEIQRKASIGTKGVVQQQAKADTIRLQQALLKEGYDLGKWGADGNWGRATDAAIAQAEKDGWIIDGHKLVKKQPTTQGTARNASMAGVDNPVTNPSPYSMRGAMDIVLGGNSTGSTDPFVALATAKALGTFGANRNYEYPEEHIPILSDQNQYIFDNWEAAMDYNYSATNNRLQKLLKTYNETKDPAERQKLQAEIDDHKKSMKSILANKTKYSKAGGLKKYLMANPGEKVVIGGNFRFYKDNNQHRFPEGTPTGYASFDKHPDYVGWARNAPLGQVETIYGNNVHSWVYNPETNQIETASSDEYNFNSIGSELSSKIGKLRTAVGEDDALNKTSIKYRSALRPIKLDGTDNYITNSDDFGHSRTANLWERLGLGTMVAMGEGNLGEYWHTEGAPDIVRTLGEKAEPIKAAFDKAAPKIDNNKFWQNSIIF